MIMRPSFKYGGVSVKDALTVKKESISQPLKCMLHVLEGSPVVIVSHAIRMIAIMDQVGYPT